MVNEMRKTGKKGKVTQAVLLVLLFMAVAVAGYSGFRLWKYYHEYLEDQELYEDLRDEILQTPELETDTESVSELDTRKKYHKTSESEIPFDVDWDELKDINEDIIGWVYFTGFLTQFCRQRIMNIMCIAPMIYLQVIQKLDQFSWITEWLAISLLRTP